MNIEQINIDLLSSTSKSYTVRASVSSGMYCAQAISKGKSIAEAEEEAIKQAEKRFVARIGREIGTQPASKERAKAEPPKSKSKEARKELDQKTAPPQTNSSTGPEQSVEGAKEELLPETEQRRRAIERLEAIIEMNKLDEGEAKAAFNPPMWPNLATKALEGLADYFELGVPEEEQLDFEKCAQLVKKSPSIEDLKEKWNHIKGVHWSSFTPKARLKLWRAKEEAKGKIAKTEHRAPQAQPVSGTRTSCKSCNATIEWVSTKSGKNHPVDPLSRPVYLEGEGKGEKRFVWLDGVAQLVDTWPAPPGVGDAHMSYQSHFATCPHANKHRRQGK